MRGRDGLQLGEEGVDRGVVHEVMRQQAGRLGGIDQAVAPAAQMADQLAQCLGGADEAAIAPPGDHVDMRVDEGETAIPAGLLRLSVGIEDVEDLWVDLDRALSVPPPL